MNDATGLTHMSQEDRFRMAETLIQGAKKFLWPEWDDYADVQKLMNELENARIKMTLLITKVVQGN